MKRTYEATVKNGPLVICDGPPSQTLGGRYGLMPVMREKLGKRSIVLLDDAPREKHVSIRWTSEFNMSYECLGLDRPFIRLTLPEVEA